MIHRLLNLTRPLIIYDTETTGLDTKQDRIVEIGFQQWTAEGLMKEYRTLVNPGVPIPAKATEVHGITDAMVQGCRTCGRGFNQHPYELKFEESCPEFKPWPTFRQLAANLAKGFSGCDFAGKNVRFDLRITAAEMARAGVEWRYDGARIIDIDRLEAWLNKRSLSHLYRKYTGKTLEGAHGALTDVKGSTEILGGQFEAFTQNEDDPLMLPRCLDQLHQLQWPGWIDSEGSFLFVDGVPCFGRWGKYAGQPMAKADVGYWDWILKNDFSAEIKTLAGQAKLGKFPEAK